MKIVLIGYRGTGKSAVGTLIAERLGMICVGMDARIVEKAGMSIPEIVAQRGWPGFRDLESEVAREYAAQDGLVIDADGGVIERPENVEVLRANGAVFWLKASVPTIVSRIQGDTQRPSLTGGKSFVDEVAEVLAAAQAEKMAVEEPAAPTFVGIPDPLGVTDSGKISAPAPDPEPVSPPQPVYHEPVSPPAAAPVTPEAPKDNRKIWMIGGAVGCVVILCCMCMLAFIVVPLISQGGF
ncbi:MAG: hypothetical protein HUU38_16390 [Anaerolineales bacterium]|nr:hypothetical protein [Anaerolineales bacterium]